MVQWSLLLCVVDLKKFLLGWGRDAFFFLVYKPTPRRQRRSGVEIITQEYEVRYLIRIDSIRIQVGINRQLQVRGASFHRIQGKP
jgi:hypothetical protein